MIPEGLRKPAQTLNEAFKQSMSIYRFATGSSPLWYGLVLSELVLLVDDAEIVYATGRFEAAQSRARFLVMTDRLVIDVHVTKVSGELGEREIRAVRRSRIQSLGVEAGETPFSSSAFSDWPGAITITANYEGLGEQAVFPLERGQERNELALLAALRSDLTGAV